MSGSHPFVAQTVLDCRHPRVLAEFYRALLGYGYRPGDEPPPPGEPDPRGEDWLVIGPVPHDRSDGRGLAFQANAEYVAPVWTPHADRPGEQQMMLHLDLTVRDVESLTAQRERALELGAAEALDRSDDPDEPLYVFLDPAGHPFCIFVSPWSR